jgi:hypothetical protein
MLKEKEASILQRISGLDSKLQKLIHEAITRRQYLREQEKLIAKTVEDGNFELKSIQYQIGNLLEIKKEIERELFDYEQDKSIMLLELDKLQNKLA